MKTLIILGSTGSLGTQALEVIEKYPNEFKVIGISAHKNKELLEKQARKFRVDEKKVVLASNASTASPLLKLATLPEADIIVNVLSGTAGIAPTVAALENGKTVLLGNKESLIAEGEKIKDITRIIPLDSEHNAIFEILKKYMLPSGQTPPRIVKKIILPASGGPFWNKSAKEIADATPAYALAHPKWNMGKKISIESATLINKGFEIIEAHYLFDLALDKIDVVIHPECLVHGMVEFESSKPESELIAYISPPDMREHIENALLHTLKKPATRHFFGTTPRQIRPLNPNEFTFHAVPHDLLPGIKLVTKAFKKDPHNMKNFLKKEEEAIFSFLQGKTKFQDLFVAP